LSEIEVPLDKFFLFGKEEHFLPVTTQEFMELSNRLATGGW